MTREEAIELIDDRMCFGRGKWSKHHEPEIDEYWQAGQMAIEALRAQDVPDTNVGDTISREAAIDAVDEALTRVFVEHRDIAEKMINKIPSAQPDLSEYSDKLWRTAFERGKAEGKEERKTGRWKFYGKETWVRDDGKPVFIQCSECNATVINNGSAEWNFCPVCGADMRGENDATD